MSKKLKSLSIIAIPRDTVEANVSLFRIGAIDREITEAESAFESEVARLRKETDAKTANIIAERESRLASLQAFANANRTTLLSGDKKSVDLSAGTIGWRWNPAKVVLAAGGEKKALATLKELKLKKFIRIKEAIDKEALLKDRPEVPGIRFRQTEQFFVEAKVATDPEACTNVIALARSL